MRIALVFSTLLLEQVYAACRHYRDCYTCHMSEDDRCAWENFQCVNTAGPKPQLWFDQVRNCKDTQNICQTTYDNQDEVEFRM